jgi:hypothetical protein
MMMGIGCDKKAEISFHYRKINEKLQTRIKNASHIVPRDNEFFFHSAAASLARI